MKQRLGQTCVLDINRNPSKVTSRNIDTARGKLCEGNERCVSESEDIGDEMGGGEKI